MSTARSALAFAEHAAQNQADAVMPMPPLLQKANTPVMGDYYRRIAAVGLATIIQNAPPSIGTPQAFSALATLLASHSKIRYLKEEALPHPPPKKNSSSHISGHRVS